MSRVAIVAALPGELKPLVRSWEHNMLNGVHLWRWKFDNGECVAACAGMGADAATRAFAEIERNGPVSYVISLGWAGALSDEVAPGEVTGISGVIDARTGERFLAAHWSRERWLVTVSQVAGKVEKQRLAGTYGAALVDMEAATIARLAAMRDIPLYVIKGVSDGLHDRLPDFNAFQGKRGEFLLTRFVLCAMLRPQYWPALMRMGENSRKAAAGMAEAVLDFLDERGYIRRRNGYPGNKRNY